MKHMAIQAHTLYDNFVLENKLTDLLETKLNTRSLMKIDTSLAEAPGMIKTIHTYRYDGSVEELARGEGNTSFGQVSFEAVNYVVKLAQQGFEYADEDVMKDPMVVEAGMEGASTVMVNDINSQYFAELEKATLSVPGPVSYDVVVDAIAKLNTEDESGLFLIIGPDQKATVRKDPDFKSARLGEILFNGQIGEISGVPVLVSKKVPVGAAYLAHKDAVTLFVKKDSEVEQDRDANIRRNRIFMRKVNLVALTDATKVVKITGAAGYNVIRK